MNHAQFTAALRPGSRVIVAALVPAKGDADRSIISAMTQTVEETGATVVGTLIQRRGVSRARTPRGVLKLRFPLRLATFIGKGKVVELGELVSCTQAEIVAFCNPLTETQKGNLEQATGVAILWYRPEVENCLS